MKVLNENEASDVEMLTYGMTVINKTLNGISDQVYFFIMNLFSRLVGDKGDKLNEIAIKHVIIYHHL